MKDAVSSVEVETFGAFSVRVNGAPLLFPAKAQRKPLELLKVLIALGADAVPEPSLTDALWPDADGDAAHRSFSTTLHRLRRLIGFQALRVGDGRLSLDGGLCRTDCHALDRLLREAEAAAERKDGEAELAFVRRALAIYRGRFLEGEFALSEILVARERWHGRMLRCVTACADRLTGRAYPAAVEILQRAIELDGFAEELHQRLIRCLEAQGRRAEAISAYERCRRLLREGAGIDPAPETEALHRALLHQRASGGTPAGFAGSAPSPAPSPLVAPAGIADQASAPRPESERRRLTVLALGWVTDHPASAGRPEEGAEQQDSLRAALARAVEEQGGIVNLFQPGQCLALFGWPAAHEDDPVRAVRAALAWVAGTESRDGEAEDSGALRAGVASGLMVVAPGSAVDGRYRLTGRPQEEALRLLARAAPGTALVDAATLPAIAGYFRTRAEKSGRGKARAPAYRILSATPARSAFEAAGRRGFTPFTGRAEELARLEAALERAARGQGQFFTIAGEAGLGKSRLVHEFRGRIDRSRFTVLEGRCQSYGGGTPYLPLLDALRRGLQLSASDPPDTLKRKAVANLLAIDPALAPYLPHCLHLLSIPSSEHPLPANLQGDALRRAFEEALAAVVIASAQRRPLVLIYEDWHWADEASESALRHLLGLVPRHPLLTVVLHRPEYQPHWGNLAHHQTLALTSLAAEDTAAMLRFRFKAKDVSPDLAALVHERTGGNPFFVEELAQSLLAEGTVRIENGRAVLARKVDAELLPGSVEAVVRSRMDRLDASAREALRWAAVIGREFPRRILERVYAAPAPLPDVLDRLAAEDLIQPMRLLPEPEHRFKHVLAQVAVYETLLLQQRNELHARVGQAIERLYADRIEEHYEALAHHFSRSDDTDKAIEYLEKAGDKAVGYSSLVEARAHYQAAIKVLGELVPTETLKRKHVELSVKWATISFWAYSDEIVDSLETACVYARQMDNDELWARAAGHKAAMLNFMGKVPEAVKLAEKVVEIGDELEDQAPVGMAYYALGSINMWESNISQATNLLERANARLFGSRTALEGYSIALLGYAYGWKGEFSNSFEQFRKALIAAERIGIRSIENVSIFWRGCARYFKGEWAVAVADFDIAIRTAEEMGDVFSVAWNTTIKGYAVFMGGDKQGGLSTARRGLHSLEDRFFGSIAITIAYSFLGEPLCLSGQIEEALKLAQKTLDYRKPGDNFGELMAQRVFALAAAQSSPPDWNRTEAAIERGVRLAKERGARPDQAIGHFRYAEILHKKGDRDRALEQLGEAEKLFAAMEMTWWLEQAVALRARIEVGKPFVWFAPYAEGPPKLDE